jgi:hypothetical protein
MIGLTAPLVSPSLINTCATTLLCYTTTNTCATTVREAALATGSKRRRCASNSFARPRRLPWQTPSGWACRSRIRPNVVLVSKYTRTITREHSNNEELEQEQVQVRELTPTTERMPANA